jgi:hypothetical protein
MRKLLFFALGLVTASTSHGQSFFNFNNFGVSALGGPTSAITVASGGVAGEGNPGDYVGSTYNASLYYEVGSFSGTVSPSSLTLASGASAVLFFGVTGVGPNHGPTVDGAGLFDGGPVTIPGVPDGTIISVEVAVWYAGPGATSYATAVSHGYNAGYSALSQVRLVSGGDDNVASLAALSFASGSGFVPVFVPEPGTIALGTLSGATLLLLRRRK